MGRNPVQTFQNLPQIVKGELAPSAPSFSSHPSSGIIPASLAQRFTGDGGLYAGPTSAATFLASLVHEDDKHEVLSVLLDPRIPRTSISASGSSPRDLDILALLPDLSIVDNLINFYYESSTWENRYLNYEAFMSTWSKFKNDSDFQSIYNNDRIFMATVFLIMAIAALYLPSRHQLIAPLNTHPSDLAENYYNQSCILLQRYRMERHPYTLEFVELLLLNTHYQLVTKERCEDLWSSRGELVSVATAMGLHRDPSMWKLPKEEAERHRWAWWNILLTDRWTSFLFGRPLGIANHHFDTSMPGPLDPSIDPSQQLHLPQILIFRLVEILGEIMEDAVSVRPVPHERIMAHDRNLQQWFESFPEELNFNDYQLAKSLASDVLSIRRSGLVSLCMRVMYNHIRFTLHRPYAKSPKYSAAECAATGHNGLTEAQFEQSLEIAINAADRVLYHAMQAKHDFIANKMLLVPGHINWGMVHMFNAAMFFVDQILADPEQPGANLFRGNVKRGIVLAESMRGLPVSDKAYSILAALTPLYDDIPNRDISEHQLEERENKRRKILNFVRRLPFPCFSNPANSPVVVSMPQTTVNNSFSPYSSGSSVSGIASQNNNNNNSSNARNNTNTVNEYPIRNPSHVPSRLVSRKYSHSSLSPPYEPSDSLNHSAMKTPLLPPLSHHIPEPDLHPRSRLEPSPSPLPIMNLQVPYQPQTQPHSLYPPANEHSHGPTSTHVHPASEHSVLNSYILSGGHAHNSSAASSSHVQGTSHPNVGNGENGAMWGSSMEVDSSTWDGFISVVPPVNE